MGIPTKERMYRTKTSSTGYTTTDTVMVITAFSARTLVNLEPEGPKSARKVLQKMRV